MRGPWIATGLLLASIVGGVVPAGAADTFLKSDDFKDGEEVVNVFFKEAEYGRLVEDIERNDAEFDWGWAKQTGKKAAKPKVLAFDIRTAKTIRISFVKNFARAIHPGIEDAVRQSFTLAWQQMGLQVVQGPADPADLELQLAIVDIKATGTFAWVANIPPFVEIELRLMDARTGEDLLLIRNQEHGPDPNAAAGSYASELIEFLR